MLRARSRYVLIALLLAVLAAAAFAWLKRESQPQPGAPIGLFTTLPLLWSENPDITASLNPDRQPHWAKAVIEARGPIVPLDMLAGSPGHAPLDKVSRLIMAQPRVLGPQENVALDAWVRGGGRLLLIADPALTEESAFPIGDPRRPQAVALLSPILAHWGLELRFDEHQTIGEQDRAAMGVAIPTNLAGHFVTQGQSNCKLWSEGLVVTCAIGKGRVVAVADAAMLEREGAGTGSAKALSWLLDAAFVGR